MPCACKQSRKFLHHSLLYTWNCQLVLFAMYRYGFGAYFNILPGSEWSALMLTYGFPLAIIGMALKVNRFPPPHPHLLEGMGLLLMTALVLFSCLSGLSLSTLVFMLVPWINAYVGPCSMITFTQR